MLTEGQRRRFFTEGFVLQPDVFSAAEVQRMRHAFERLAEAASALGASGMHRGSQFVLARNGTRGQAGISIQRVVWCGAAEPVLSAYGMDPRLLEMAAQLLGSHEMSQLINQAHFKLPGDGVSFPWHQDSTHRRYGRGEWNDTNGRGSYVQTLTAIDDMTRDNGALELIPGSCALGHVESVAGRGVLPQSIRDASPVLATMTAGSVMLFGPYTFHRSLPNESRRARRAFINGFAYPGANSRVYPGQGAGRRVSA